MRLYLARHGQAASPEAGAALSLTAQGQADVTRVGQELLQRKLNIQQIWHSPKTRTRQTAAIYASLLGINTFDLIEKKELLIDGDVALLYHDILESKIDHLLLVSHEPLLEELSSFLVPDSDQAALFFPTSSVAAFQQSDPWQRLWLLEPSTLK